MFQGVITVSGKFSSRACAAFLLITATVLSCNSVQKKDYMIGVWKYPDESKYDRGIVFYDDNTVEFVEVLKTHKKGFGDIIGKWEKLGETTYIIDVVKSGSCKVRENSELLFEIEVIDEKTCKIKESGNTAVFRRSEN
jgi:hypothetical protein